MAIEIEVQEMKDLILVRNYFGKNDKTIFEHFAFSVLDNLIKKNKETDSCTTCGMTVRK